MKGIPWSPSLLLGSLGLSRTMAITQSQGLGSCPSGTCRGTGEGAQFLNARKCAMCDWSLQVPADPRIEVWSVYLCFIWASVQPWNT